MKNTQNKKIDPRTVEQVVLLRKNYQKIPYIVKKTGLTLYYVKKILRTKLGNSYYDYRWDGKRSYTPEFHKKIVDLRKQFLTLQEITDRVGISENALISILEIELGEDYKKYCNRGITYQEKVKKSLKINAFSFAELYDQVTVKTPFHKYQELKEEAIYFMNELMKKIRKGTHLRNELKVNPFALYLFLKSRYCIFTTGQYLILIGLSKREFFKGIKAILPYYPQYQTRNRKKIVSNSITAVEEYLNIDSAFLTTAFKLLDKWWDTISNSTEDVITGVICILSVIKLNIKSPSYTTICRLIGIRLGSVYNNLKRRFGIVDIHNATQINKIL